MDSPSLLIGYIALCITFIALIAGACAVKGHRKLLITLVAIAGILVFVLTFIIWKPLSIAVKSSLEMPDGLEKMEGTVEDTDNLENSYVEIHTAWGPQDRVLYETTDPISDKNTFNSLIDNAVIGNETNFVRIREAGVGAFADDVNLEPGKDYEVFIYYHNNGDATSCPGM